MKFKTILFLLICLTALVGCNDDDTGQETSTVRFTFSHTWENQTIDAFNLTTINVTNANGETMNFARIRYLVSRFQLEDAESGQVYLFDGYKFTDVSEVTQYNFTPDNNSIPSGSYRLKFIWGFNEEDNVDGAYADLNSASWNWPMMLGGGYHFLQMDGNYNLDSNPSNYNFHNGTARFSTNPPVFEPNFKLIEFSELIEVSGATTIDIKMDFAEFFANPHTWDLNELDTPLMPNYMAQKMMQDNVSTVFSINSIIED